LVGKRTGQVDGAICGKALRARSTPRVTISEDWVIRREVVIDPSEAIRTTPETVKIWSSLQSLAQRVLGRPSVGC